MKKIYVITFHTEDLTGTYSKRTITITATSIVEVINELEKSWCKENTNLRIVIDLIYSEADK